MLYCTEGPWLVACNVSCYSTMPLNVELSRNNSQRVSLIRRSNDKKSTQKIFKYNANHYLCYGCYKSGIQQIIATSNLKDACKSNIIERLFSKVVAQELDSRGHECLQFVLSIQENIPIQILQGYTVMHSKFDCANIWWVKVTKILACRRPSLALNCQFFV